jgi:hypothetical protein
VNEILLTASAKMDDAYAWLSETLGAVVVVWIGEHKAAGGAYRQQEGVCECRSSLGPGL